MEDVRRRPGTATKRRQEGLTVEIRKTRLSRQWLRSDRLGENE